jgi:hypothetical protein
MDFMVWYDYRMAGAFSSLCIIPLPVVALPTLIMKNQTLKSPSDQPESPEGFGNLPNDSEPFGSVRHDTETFRRLPNSSAGFRNVPNHSERKESHTLTVREVARHFEASGVARTERSIINWCHPNKQGVSRLDCYFEPNEGKYFITPQSVELAIREEQAKAVKNTMEPPSSERPGDVPKPSEGNSEPSRGGAAESTEQVKALQQEVMDLKITNRAKDFFIEQLQKEREGFTVERREYVEQLMTFNRRVGELETKLLLLGTAQPEYSSAAEAAPGASARVDTPSGKP